MIYIKSEQEIAKMREAARILKKALEAIEKNIAIGVTTLELDRIADDVIKSEGAKASFNGVECMYPQGKTYLHATCMSVNEEIIHGIPNNRKLQDGDVLCVDIGVCKNGFHSDAGRTYIVGEGSEIAKRLVKTAEQAFFAGIDKAIVGNRIGDISNAIENTVKKAGFKLLKEYEGHGVGRELHEDPEVPNSGMAGRGPRLQKGMTIAVEPMIVAGDNKVEVGDDWWVVKTCDKSLTAYYENTIVITDKEAEILTL